MTNIEIELIQTYRDYIANCLIEGDRINQIGWSLSFLDPSYEYKGTKYYKKLGFKNNGLYTTEPNLNFFEQKYKNRNNWYIFKDSIIDLLI